MSLKYYIREDGNGAYCVSESTDYLYDKNCIDVPIRPTENHMWNNSLKTWELSIDLYLSELRAKRDEELKRTDKFMISDYPISEVDKNEVIQYRHSLRECPNKETTEEKVLPGCPAICEK